MHIDPARRCPVLNHRQVIPKEASCSYFVSGKGEALGNGDQLHHYSAPAGVAVQVCCDHLQVAGALCTVYKRQCQQISSQV
jgi:hypothetical protein